jgi:alpha-L-fucosidase
MTINSYWGVSHSDEDHKSTRTLMHYLVRSAAAGANYLLNVGPTAEGQILPIHAQRLRQMGAWLGQHAPSIYNTRKGAFLSGSAAPWYSPNKGAFTASNEAVSTRNADTHYIHLLNYTSDCVRLKDLTGQIDVSGLNASLLRDGAPVKASVDKDNLLLLTVPAEQRDPIDTVVTLKPTN